MHTALIVSREGEVGALPDRKTKSRSAVVEGEIVARDLTSIKLCIFDFALK